MVAIFLAIVEEGELTILVKMEYRSYMSDIQILLK